MTEQGMHEELRGGTGRAGDEEGLEPAAEIGIDVVLVTGLSGAGRGTAAKVLEDLGWYVADNLPPGTDRADGRPRAGRGVRGSPSSPS